jgi:hypothetical protein
MATYIGEPGVEQRQEESDEYRIETHLQGWMGAKSVKEERA